jgi:cell division protein FtsQ
MVDATLSNAWRPPLGTESLLTYTFKMKRIRRVLTVLLLAALLVGAAFGLMYQSGLFKANHLSLVSSEAGDLIFEQNQAQLQNLLNAYRGQDIWKVDVKKIAEDFRRRNWVKSVQVQRIFPNMIRVEVTPKKAALAIFTDHSRVIPVSEEGDLLPVVPLTKAPDVPLLRQKKFLREASLRDGAVQLMQKLPVSGNLSQKTVSEISVDEKNNYWLTLIQNNLAVKIGSDISNTQLKAARVEKVIDYLDSHKIQARLVDADFSKKVIVKVKAEANRSKK